MVRDDTCDHGLHSGAIADVGLIRLRFPALATDLRHNSFGFIGRTAMVDSDRCAFGSEREGNFASDVSCSAGYESNAILQL
jgi:hypothetical protein